MGINYLNFNCNTISTSRKSNLKLVLVLRQMFSSFISVTKLHNPPTVIARALPPKMESNKNLPMRVAMPYRCSRVVTADKTRRLESSIHRNNLQLTRNLRVITKCSV
ncbi:hypothetical protein CEXT_295741 [Caerostris extrusa]|uniref:Uncharacterized protein n=1 Tax=Caerostris extrusa TaxID=172846 RepID=A0AAV4YE27_CAEEX|nr:hypothetical protein CEXT_295741 [Caerostris extrusa]